jgi:hypothetical protein
MRIRFRIQLINFQLYFFPFLVIKILDPDTDSLEMLDPDPDPQHCILLNIFYFTVQYLIPILPALCCVDPVYSPLKINWNM